MMLREYAEEDFLLLSGIQHFVFCRRQWALIHIEKQWSDNYYTVAGSLLHEKAHDPYCKEKRGDLLITRAMPVHSYTLGVSGECDVVEWRRSENGITVSTYPGKWSVCPVEYKRGGSKADDCDRLQLAAQAICLEEMLCCEIPEGYLYYDKTRRREKVPISDALREAVRKTTDEMHKYFADGYTPKVKKSAKCTDCSFSDLCIPELFRVPSVQEYLNAHLLTKEETD